MSRFKVGVSAAAPLQIQITSPSGGPLSRLVKVEACGETNTGLASRPAISRPSTPGTGTGPAIERLPIGGADPLCTVITSFTTQPSLPSLSSGSFALPIVVLWESEEGIWFMPGGAPILLYAQAGSGHSWTAEAVWEELL